MERILLFGPVLNRLPTGEERRRFDKPKQSHRDSRTGPWAQSSNVAQQLSFEDEFALLVLLCIFIRLVIFPANRLLALPACDVTDNVPPRGHVSLARLASFNVDDAVKEVGFAVLTSKVPTDDVFMVGQMGLAGFATIYFGAVEVGIVGQAHGSRGRLLLVWCWCWRCSGRRFVW